MIDQELFHRPERVYRHVCASSLTYTMFKFQQNIQVQLEAFRLSIHTALEHAQLQRTHSNVENCYSVATSSQTMTYANIAPYVLAEFCSASCSKSGANCDRVFIIWHCLLNVFLLPAFLLQVLLFLLIIFLFHLFARLLMIRCFLLGQNLPKLVW